MVRELASVPDRTDSRKAHFERISETIEILWRFGEDGTVLGLDASPRTRHGSTKGRRSAVFVSYSRKREAASSRAGLPSQFLDYVADGQPVERGEPVEGQRLQPR